MWTLLVSSRVWVTLAIPGPILFCFCLARHSLLRMWEWYVRSLGCILVHVHSPPLDPKIVKIFVKVVYGNAWPSVYIWKHYHIMLYALLQPIVISEKVSARVWYIRSLPRRHLAYGRSLILLCTCTVDLSKFIHTSTVTFKEVVTKS